jgi:FkbM family methyltransferase
VSTPPEGDAGAVRRQRALKLLSGFIPDQQVPEIARLDYAARDIFLYVTSRVERRTRTQSCAKEPWTVRWIESRVRPGDAVYDIGANVGAYSLIAGHHVAPAGLVVAIEPAYGTFAHLCDNVVLNELSDVVLPVPVSVGLRTGTTRLHFNSLAPGHARHSLSDQAPVGRQDRKVRASLRMVSMSVDDMVAAFRLPLPHHMKIDVDGTELDVLHGATGVLAAPTLRSVMIEVENVHTDEMLALFGRYGFTVAERYQRTAETGEPADWWYGVFSRGDAAAGASATTA